MRIRHPIGQLKIIKHKSKIMEIKTEFKKNKSVHNARKAGGENYIKSSL